MNFERKIKKTIWSKEHNYFIIVQPGLEEIATSEIESFGYKVEREVVGGLELNGKLDVLYDISLRSRVATKILFRIASFKASHLSDVKKHINKLDLQLFWGENTYFDIVVNSKSSKLYHTDMVKDFIAKELMSYSKENNLNYSLDKKSREKLFIRIENNEVTVSLDASGDFLYKRNIKKQLNQAPIRENVAAALLLKYWNKEEFFLDPMCGSATFSIEAAMIKNNIIPGAKRKFNFMNWVSFREKTFKFMKRKYTENKSFDIENIELSDLSQKSVDVTNKNISIFNNLNAKKQNFFEMSPSKESGFIIMNLPYNKRIKVEKNFYQKIEKKLLKDFKGWNYLILVAKNNNFNKLEMSDLKIKNGGILLNVYHGNIGI